MNFKSDIKFTFQVSQMFQDKEFYIVNGPTSHSKALLEKKVAEVFLTFIHLSTCYDQSQHFVGQCGVEDSMPLL